MAEQNHTLNESNATKLFAAPNPRADAENELWKQPDGTLIHKHINTDGGEKIIATGDTLDINPQLGDAPDGIDDIVAEHIEEILLGYGACYDAHWKGDTISISTNMDGYEAEETEQLRDAPYKHDLTATISLE